MSVPLGIFLISRFLALRFRLGSPLATNGRNRDFDITKMIRNILGISLYSEIFDKKYEYFSVLKEINNSKLKLLLKILSKFSFKNLIKITAIVLLPRRFVFRFIDNV